MKSNKNLIILKSILQSKSNNKKRFLLSINHSKYQLYFHLINNQIRMNLMDPKFYHLMIMMRSMEMKIIKV